MTDPYSVLLGLSAAALAISWLFLLAKRWRYSLPSSVAAAVAALALDSGSFLVHWAGGHRPGTPEAMTPALFVREHPAFVVVAVGALIALAFAASLRQHAQRAA